MDWDTYQQHQKERWINFRDEVKPECKCLGRQYYDRSDKKTKCSKCKKEVK